MFFKSKKKIIANYEEKLRLIRISLDASIKTSYQAVESHEELLSVTKDEAHKENLRRWIEQERYSLAVLELFRERYDYIVDFGKL